MKQEHTKNWQVQRWWQFWRHLPD